MMAGRPSRAITLAIVKVLPEPVTPSSVWKASPSRTPSTSLAIASGWSPDGGYGWNSAKGESGKCTYCPATGVPSVDCVTGGVFMGNSVQWAND